jgi:hypothetical protein
MPLSDEIRGLADQVLDRVNEVSDRRNGSDTSIVGSVLDAPTRRSGHDALGNCPRHNRTGFLF